MSDLASVKTGDFVLVVRGRGNMSRSTVSKVTKFHIIVGTPPCDRKYRIKTGNYVSNTAWDIDYIKTYDEAEWQKNLQREADRTLVRSLQGIDWRQVPIEKVREINAILGQKGIK
jgi:uncharacterized protein YjlB